MKTRKEHVSKEKKTFSNKKAVMISAALVAMIISGFAIFQIFLATPEIKFSLKAAIIDQVGENYPSTLADAREFNETATSILEQAGFNVSYYESESITVNFYKGLAKYNYGIIILRSHFAKRGNETEVDIFSSEEFRENAYDDVTKGHYLWEPDKYYFAITSNFVRHLEGQFPKSIVIGMGCWSLKPEYEEMADAFIQKGCIAYIGWTEDVTIEHSDKETIRLLRMLLEQNRTISDAVSRIYPDLLSGSEMDFYPHSAGDLRISDLIVNADTSEIVQIKFDDIGQYHIMYVASAVRWHARRISELAFD